MPVGHHGESIARLLRPGIHSGTIPKLFHRLLAAQLKKSEAAIHRRSEALGEVSRAVEHFLHREFIALLNAHPAWQKTPLALGEIRLGPTSIGADLFCPALGVEPAQICFEHRSSWILASVVPADWMTALSDPAADLLELALLGLFKMSAVDAVAAQIESLFPTPPAAFDIRRRELIVFFGAQLQNQAAYVLDEDQEDRMIPAITGPDALELPALSRAQVLLKERQVKWTDWSRAWEPDPLNLRRGAARAAVGDIRVLAPRRALAGGLTQ